jgi:hypothetical protein
MRGKKINKKKIKHKKTKINNKTIKKKTKKIRGESTVALFTCFTVFIK